MRLIDAEALKEEVKTIFCPDGYKIMMLERIDNAPAIIKCSMTSDGVPLMDLRPRLQGEWITVKQDTILGTFEVKNKVCDQCNHATKYEYPFCPNCGAKMKGGVEE